MQEQRHALAVRCGHREVQKHARQRTARVVEQPGSFEDLRRRERRREAQLDTQQILRNLRTGGKHRARRLRMEAGGCARTGEQQHRQRRQTCFHGSLEPTNSG